jgi:hypothetical protein
MSAFCLDLVRKHYPQLRVPFTQAYPQYVLLELSDLESEDHARALFESLMEDALARGVIDNAAVAESVAAAASAPPGPTFGLTSTPSAKK